MRVRATIEYDGADFSGWQRLPKARTVQGDLEQALTRLTGESTRVVGSGRTDAGVHAAGQVAHFDTNWDMRRGLQELARGLNALLARDIGILGLDAVPDDFHARHSATSRIYRYRILAAKTRSPLRRRLSWHVRYELEVSRMREAASAFVGQHDFAAFGRPTSRSGVTERRLDACTVTQAGDEIRLEIEANAFLRHQVRRMTGFLVDIGRGALPTSAIADALEGTWVGPPPRRAPAQGLLLWSVRYTDWSSRSVATSEE